MNGFRAIALMGSVLLLGAFGTAQAMDTNIRSYVCQKLDDFTATMTVVKANQRELSKISPDFGLLYRFKSVLMRYKEPNKVRIEGSVEGAKGVYVLNGSIQFVSFPKLGIRTRRDFGKSPGKRKSLMDVGLISDFYLSYVNAKFLREGTVDGVPVAVFDMTYKDRDEDTSHHIIYVDPKTRVVLKRESYSQEGKLQAIYYYRDLQEVRPGIWFPTRIEAQNTDRVVAGVTAYQNIRVNVGLADSIFQL